jgi:hypothetical protein
MRHHGAATEWMKRFCKGGERMNLCDLDFDKSCG